MFILAIALYKRNVTRYTRPTVRFVIKIVSSKKQVDRLGRGHLTNYANYHESILRITREGGFAQCRIDASWLWEYQEHEII